VKGGVEISRGEGRTKVILSARYLGEGLVVCRTCKKRAEACPTKALLRLL